MKQIDVLALLPPTWPEIAALGLILIPAALFAWDRLSTEPPASANPDWVYADARSCVTAEYAWDRDHARAIAECTRRGWSDARDHLEAHIARLRLRERETPSRHGRPILRIHRMR